ncbi:MAG: prepilin-type N-terminal cleavage/methylation domain-containing protein [Bacilli bacterium]|nr:prepilin-type N-terminal cleavage/methylation domain-containing protein [Bacilli bacterium]
MKKKGFTLIELLGVIVVIGLILVLIIPKIKDIYDDSKKEIYLNSTKKIVSLFNEYYAKENIKKDFIECQYDFNKTNNSCENFSFSGKKPNYGNIKIDKLGNIDGYVIFEKYYFIIQNGNISHATLEVEPGKQYTFDFTGDIKEFITEYPGYYKLEVWGAQGGSYDTYIGGYGSYSVGTTLLNNGEKLYIAVGGKGETVVNGSVPGGYNGGGSATTSSINDHAGSGGGATHIALKTGELSSLSTTTDKILIVAGGGGGAYYYSNFNSDGGHGGGIKGALAPSGTCGSDRTLYNGINADQKNGGTSSVCFSESDYSHLIIPGTFGKGGNAIDWSAGGGAGYYGGGIGYAHGANGGSGYIGNALLTDKAMYCYNCIESAEPNTKTITTTNVSDEPISGYAKKQNGYAKITYLGL